MDSQTLGRTVRRLRQAALPHDRRTDAELLHAFSAKGDASAFAEIVCRHGPMVLGVCRRTLRDTADADDAFQATFLVLVRKASGLRQPERLAGWLHEVACRTSRKLRSARLKRQGRETALFDIAVAESSANFIWRELRPIFDEELSRLPEKLRVPAVLCFLEGQSKREAARSLGWPEGTFSSRLQRARERLRIRFAAKGLTLSSGALATALFEGVGSASVSPVLIDSTVQLIAKDTLASTAIHSLANGVMQTMFVAKLKTLAAGVMLCGILGTGTSLVWIPGSGTGEAVAGQERTETGPVPRVVSTETIPQQLADGIAFTRKKMKQEESDAAWFGTRIKGQTDSTSGTTRWKLFSQRSKRDRLADSMAKGEATQADLDRLDRQIEQTEELLKALPVRTPEELRLEEVTNRIVELRSRATFVENMVRRGYMTQAELKKVQSEIALVEAEEKQLVGSPKADKQRASLQAELDLYRERLAWEERMLAKKFVTESQVRKTKQEIARVEAALAKPGIPKALEPMRAALEATIQKLEKIVEQTAAGVKKGIVPHAELLNSELTLLRYRLKLVRLTEPTEVHKSSEALFKKLEEIIQKLSAGVERGTIPLQELFNAEAVLVKEKFELLEHSNSLGAVAAIASDPRLAAMEALIKKMEEIVEKTAEGVRKGIIPQQELLNAERTVLEYKFKLLEILPAARSPASPTQSRKASVEARERELARAEILLKQKVISLMEVQRLRALLSRLRAEEAESLDEYARALKHREASVAELLAVHAATKQMHEQGTASRTDLRAINLAVAEAKVDLLQTETRRHLAEIVAIREQELREAKALLEAKLSPIEEVRKAELGLAEAKARLAKGR